MRRRLAHGASPTPRNSLRPFLVNSFFFRQSPSLIASACSWLPSSPHANELVTMPEQLPKVAFRGCGHPNPRKAFRQQ